MKDPYLKPVIFGGLFIILLSLVFALGIFLWAILGGYLAVRIAGKITKDTISIMDGILLGIFTGALGGCGLTVITTASFRDYDNQQLLIRTLEKNWPKEMYPIPGFKEMLPSTPSTLREVPKLSAGTGTTTISSFSKSKAARSGVFLNLSCVAHWIPSIMACGDIGVRLSL